jgi:hypothetical protein
MIKYDVLNLADDDDDIIMLQEKWMKLLVKERVRIVLPIARPVGSVP